MTILISEPSPLLKFKEKFGYTIITRIIILLKYVIIWKIFSNWKIIYILKEQCNLLLFRLIGGNLTKHNRKCQQSHSPLWAVNFTRVIEKKSLLRTTSI